MNMYVVGIFVCMYEGVRLPFRIFKGAAASPSVLRNIINLICSSTSTDFKNIHSYKKYAKD